MKKVLLFFIVFPLFGLALKAQSLDFDLTSLRSEGTITIETIKRSGTQSDQLQMSSKKKQSNSQTRSEALLVNNSFLIDQLLQSGAVIFNDTVSNYLNEIAQKLLANSPSLSKKLKFYIVKTNHTNAFATERGAIFIPIGLYGKQKSESELAFTLACQIANYKNNRFFNSKVLTQPAKEQNINLKEILFLKNIYTEEEKAAAEKEAAELLKIATIDFRGDRFNSEEAISLVDKFERMLLDTAFMKKVHLIDLSANLLKINNETNKAAKGSFTSNSKNQELSESISIRQQKEKQEGQTNRSVEGSDETFLYCLDLVKFEQLILHTINRNYAIGLLENYYLQKKYPNNIFLKENMAYIMYAISRYKSYYSYYIFRKNKKWLNEYNQSVQIFNNFTSEELSSIVVKQLYLLNKEHKGNDYLNILLEEALRTQIHKNETPLSYYFKKQQKDSIVNKYNELKAIDPYKGIDTSKYGISRYELYQLQAKIKRTQKRLDRMIKFDRFIFTDLLDDPKFKTIYQKISNEENYFDLLNNSSESKSSKSKKEIRKTLNQGQSLGAQHLIMVDVSYHSISKKGTINSSIEKLKESQEELRESTYNIAQTLDLKTTYLYRSDTNKNLTNQLNDIDRLQNWIDELNSHKKVQILPYSIQFTAGLKSTYGTEYFAWIDVIKKKSKRKLKISHIALSTVSIFGLPLYIGSLFTAKTTTEFRAVIGNIKTGKAILEADYSQNGIFNNDFVKSHTYNTLLQLKRKKSND